jgi:fructose/tagatose bisphosphate aldolase
MISEFVERTGCDMLAVSVGNVHGLDIKPCIDLRLLEEISIASPVPLVMHGGSGIPFDVVRKAKEFSLIKINYGSDLRRAFIETFGEAYGQNKNACDVISLSLKAVARVGDKACELARIINS